MKAFTRRKGSCKSARSASTRCAALVLGLLVLVTAAPAFAQAPDPQPLGLGDFNNDGVVDARDAVAYLTSFGIRFNTYGVTDDTYNQRLNQFLAAFVCGF